MWSIAVAYGFNLTQSSKADSYRALRQALGLDRAQLLEYLRIKSVRNHDPQRLVVGIDP